MSLTSSSSRRLPRVGVPTLVVVSLTSLVLAISESRAGAEPTPLQTAEELAEQVATYDRLIAMQADDLRLHLERGLVLFKLGRIEASLADLDRVVEIDASTEPHLWQRGIAQYYAGAYGDCRRQFELHRVVNPNDVENAVWHFLCVCGEAGVDEARRSILPVGPDARVPMAEVYDLFRGQATVEDVLAAAGSSNAALFYAHLYVGLFLEVAYDAAGGEALGDDRALEHIAAAHALELSHFMGDVARVHLNLRNHPK